MSDGKTIKELYVGQTASLTRVFTKEDLEKYALVTGDYSEIHFNEDYAVKTIFKTCIVHGLLVGGLISGVIGMHLPGNGTIYEKQEFSFLAPVYIGDEITAVVTVDSINVERNRVTLKTVCYNQNNTVVIDGKAVVLPPKK